MSFFLFGPLDLNLLDTDEKTLDVKKENREYFRRESVYKRGRCLERKKKKKEKKYHKVYNGLNVLHLF